MCGGRGRFLGRGHGNCAWDEGEEASGGGGEHAAAVLCGAWVEVWAGGERVGGDEGRGEVRAAAVHTIPAEPGASGGGDGEVSVPAKDEPTYRFTIPAHDNQYCSAECPFWRWEKGEDVERPACVMYLDEAVGNGGLIPGEKCIPGIYGCWRVP